MALLWSSSEHRYLETPGTADKVRGLMNHGGSGLLVAPDSHRVRDDRVLVLVTFAPTHDAALVIDSVEEWDHIRRSQTIEARMNRQRPVTWLTLPRSSLPTDKVQS